MTGMAGADVAELRSLAAYFDAKANDLRTMESQLSWRIYSAPWQGPDVSRFQHDWNTNYRQVISSSAMSIRQAASVLRENADQQERASAAGTGGHGLGDIWKYFNSWLKEGRESTKNHQAALRSQLEALKSASVEDVQKWWNSLSAADREYLLTGKDPESGLPLANTLLGIQDKLPKAAVDAARRARMQLQMGEITTYEIKTALEIEGRFAWIHGNASLESALEMHADGTVDLVLSGDLGGGVNAPGGVAGATLTGEISRTYHFKSLADAMAAQDQMLRDLPPDQLGEFKHMAGDPPKYLSDELNAAAAENGATGHEDRWKGTFSVEGKIKSPDNGELSGKIAMSYEQNVNDGTSSASVAVSGKAKLDLGDGAGFSGSAEASLKLNMDRQHNIEKITIDAEGTFAGVEKLKFGDPDVAVAKALDASTPKWTGSVSQSAGVHGSVNIQVDNTPENAAMIQSYINHLAVHDDFAAAQDMARLYHVGQVVIQVDDVATSEMNVVDVDAKAFALKAGAKTEIVQNVATFYKAPNDLSYQAFTPGSVQPAMSGRY